LFPNQFHEGIDLGNVELKEFINKFNKTEIKPSDLNADFIVFYHRKDKIFLFCNTKEFPKINKIRTMSLNQVRKIAYLETKDLDIIFNEMEDIVKDKRHLAWYHEEKEEILT